VALAVPHHVVCFPGFRGLPEPVIVVQTKAVILLRLVHERPIEQEIIIQGVNFAAGLRSDEFRQEGAARRIAMIGDQIRAGRVLPRNRLNQGVLEGFGVGAHARGTVLGKSLL
jgi:hypothetical protein